MSRRIVSIFLCIPSPVFGSIQPLLSIMPFSSSNLPFFIFCRSSPFPFQKNNKFFIFIRGEARVLIPITFENAIAYNDDDITSARLCCRGLKRSEERRELCTAAAAAGAKIVSSIMHQTLNILPSSSLFFVQVFITIFTVDKQNNLVGTRKMET